MSKIVRILLLSLLILLSAKLSFASPEIKIHALPKKITFAKPIQFIIEVRCQKADGDYEIISKEPKLNNLILKEQTQSQETSESYISYFIKYVFIAKKVGQGKIYSFIVNYKKSDEKKWAELEIPAQTITVTKPFPFRLILYMVIGAILGIIGQYFVKKSRKQKQIKKDVSLQDPRQKIYLRAEETISTFASPSAKGKIAVWEEEIKKVIETHYQLPAAKKLSAQIDILKTQHLPTSEINEIIRIAETLIHTRFAMSDISSQELSQIQKTLLQYIKGKIIISPSLI